MENTFGAAAAKIQLRNYRKKLKQALEEPTHAS
jgi:hypothetical protein